MIVYYSKTCFHHIFIAFQLNIFALFNFSNLIVCMISLIYFKCYLPNIDF